MKIEEKFELIRELSSAYQRIESVHKGDSGLELSKQILDKLSKVIETLD